MTRTPKELTETPVLAPGPPGPNPLKIVPQILDLVRLSGAIFFRSDFRSPWDYSSPSMVELAAALPGDVGSLVMFHIVAKGQCWVALDGGTRHDLSRGDVVVMPYGDAHSWGSYEHAESVPVVSLLPPQPWTRLPHVEYGGDGVETKVVCGYLQGDAVLFDPVLRALPPLFVVRPPAGPARDWMNASIEFALAASTSPAVPADDAPRTDHLLPELLFREVLRLYLEERRDRPLTGWLAAMRDPLMGQAWPCSTRTRPGTGP